MRKRIKRLLLGAIGLTLLVSSTVGIAAAVQSDQQGHAVAWGQNGPAGQEVSIQGAYAGAEDCAPGVKPFGQLWLGNPHAIDIDVTVEQYLGWVQVTSGKTGVSRVLDEYAEPGVTITLPARPSSYKFWDAKWKVVPGSWIAGSTSDDFDVAYFNAVVTGDGNAIMAKIRGGCNG